jgi:hypothetical protein
MTLAAQPAAQVLDACFLEARAKLLELAAILDRIHRGPGANQLDDLRLDRLMAGLKLLLDPHPNRAALVQELFSLPYDPNWKRPEPR